MGNKHDRVSSDVKSETIRIDKLLYFLRLVKSRSIAQKICEAGHIRMDGRRIEHGHVLARENSQITMPYGNGVMMMKLCKIPIRRGPASEAREHYAILSA